MVTGESRPVTETIDDKVIGKTMNQGPGNATTAHAVLTRVALRMSWLKCFPRTKGNVVARLRTGGGVVAMAGDSVTDAPAPAAADVAIAMGTGTDVTMGSASITLFKAQWHRTGAPPLGGDDDQHLAELVLRLHLQCGRRAGCGGRLFPLFGFLLLRPAPGRNHRRQASPRPTLQDHVGGCILPARLCNLRSMPHCAGN